MVRYLSNSEDPNSLAVWVDSSQPLPDVCCTCGMFTVDRIKIKHVAPVQRSAKRATAWGIFQVLLVLFGGPIGWLLALFSSGGADEDGKTVKKIKIKIPQCVLCRSETRVEIIESRPDHSLYQFYVHPIFAQRYQTMLNESKEA